MAGAWKEQTLSLLAAANNHSNLAVKLSSLRQVKDVLLSMEPSHAAEVFPYLVELKSSPESLVRRLLIELIEETGLKTVEHSAVLMPVLVSLAKDSDNLVSRQSISSGTKFFCAVVEHIALQFHRCGKVERWAENMWHWMGKLKEVVYSILFEPFPVGTKLLAMKFLETLVLLFTPDSGDGDKSASRGTGDTWHQCLDAFLISVCKPSNLTMSSLLIDLGSERLSSSNDGKEPAFNIFRLLSGNPVLDPAVLTSEANRSLGTFLDMLRSTSSLPGPLAIAVVNCLATVARKRPLHYGAVFSVFTDLHQKLEGAKGGYVASLRYSLRSAFLGFLRCTHPAIIESKDRLLKTLRAMNASDAADQVLRQVDKMMRNRASRDTRVVKDDQTSSQHRHSGDLARKRPLPQNEKELTNGSDMPHKRVHYSSNDKSVPTFHLNDIGSDHVPSNQNSSKPPLLNNNLNPVEQMVAVIAAMLAEGERGAESLELLISQIHPDLLADIVITNMRHLPNTTLLVSKPGSQHMDLQKSFLTGSGHSMESAGATTPLQASASALSTSFTELTSSMNQPDSKRDPRRDPRRLDPRRVTPIEALNKPVKKETTPMQSSGADVHISLDKPLSPPSISHVESSNQATTISKTSSDGEAGPRPLIASSGETIPNEEKTNVGAENPPSRDNMASGFTTTSVHGDDEKTEVPVESKLASEETIDDDSFKSEDDDNSPTLSTMSVLEETCQELPPVPSYVEFSLEEEQRLRELVVEGIVGSFKQLNSAENCRTRMAVLAHLVSQVDPDQQTTTLLQKGITFDYQHQQGHELVMYVLYHLHARMVSNSSDQSSGVAASLYERLLLEVAKSLLDTLSASDKSFSRLLGDAPVLTDSALELLENVCCSEGSDQRGKDNRDGDRVTQGLGAVWSLILGRPVHRKSCLNIVLKCAVHPHDDVRSKAIRLVANKLYVLGYLSEDIENYATSMVLLAIDKATEFSTSDGRVVNDERTNSGSVQLEPSISLDSSISIPEAQRLISLYFALCTKKPSLLQLVFDIYSRASKSVKQGIHRHITTLLRALGSSNSEVLRILSNPPKGCEDLLLLVLQILTEQTTPSSDLIAAVKHLYETNLKDASILIPVLSSFSKSEVLPIFPRLVDLPLDKFQTALAHILQGSVYTGPALTPAEVLVAIHDINPEKGGIPLRKVTEACSACFEQRTVFTQQVLAKALNQMVDRTPLPLLFMRTVIQSIDAFPELVDFVMEILSKLVKRQIWKAPKLWVGFLKCVSQTQPHSFPVLLELPGPQLESSLNKYPTLRSSLGAYANQASVKASLPRSTLAVLGLLNDSSQHMQQPRVPQPPPPLHASGSSASVRGVTPT